MHELAIARDLLHIIDRTLGADNVRVLRIDLAVGAASGIAADALRFAFGVIAEGTRAHGAELSIAASPARGRCVGCGILFEFEGMIGVCPACGKLGGELLAGDGMMLRAIEVADV